MSTLAATIATEGPPSGSPRLRIPSPLWSVDTAAAYLRINPRTLAEWRVTGRGPRYVRLGRRAFYRQDEIERWLDSRVFTGLAAEQATAETKVSHG